MKNILLSVMIAIMAVFDYSKPIDNQPPPLIIDECTYIQPIVENEDLDDEYKYTRSIKFYYRDPMPNPVILRNGSIVSSYCSDQSQITFITMLNDTITQLSVKSLNCKIAAIANFEQSDIIKLKKAKLKIFKIKNIVSENEYTYHIHTDYFQKYLIP